MDKRSKAERLIFMLLLVVFGLLVSSLFFLFELAKYYSSLIMAGP